MVRHSKNNTASGVFTYAERQMVDYGTKSKRLGVDSKRPFDACHLCLNTARIPTVCARGHIFCKECVVANILEQKQSIQSLQREYKDHMKREKLRAEAERAQADAREVQRYIRSEAGLSETGRRPRDDELPDQHDAREEKPAKRVCLLENKSSEPSRAVVFARGREKQLAAQTTGASKDAGDAGGSKLRSSFWVPSQAPEAARTLKDPSQLTVQCNASSEPHALKLKHMTAVHFRTSATGEKLCPACDKALLSSSKIDVLRPCGHAMCHRCVSNFVLPAGECFVCQKAVNSEADDVIRLTSDGTGFSGGGGQMVASRYDSALQA
ncbi:hypothetical protein GGI11_000528 [Coemansia sp. RSA 2049]|nr:hypothetical protein GGI11_000528 [Coemansia sp. RSA 2049]